MPPGLGVGQDDAAHAALGEPEHVAVVADKIAAVVHHRHAPPRVDHEPHAVIVAGADHHLGRAPPE